MNCLNENVLYLPYYRLRKIIFYLPETEFIGSLVQLKVFILCFGVGVLILGISGWDLNGNVAARCIPPGGGGGGGPPPGGGGGGTPPGGGGGGGTPPGGGGGGGGAGTPPGGGGGGGGGGTPPGGGGGGGGAGIFDGCPGNGGGGGAGGGDAPENADGGMLQLEVNAGAGGISLPMDNCLAVNSFNVCEKDCFDSGFNTALGTLCIPLLSKSTWAQKSLECFVWNPQLSQNILLCCLGCLSGSGALGRGM